MKSLSKILSGTYPKVEVKTKDNNYATNHFLFINVKKFMAKSESILKEMICETKQFFSVVGLEMNKDKSATNAKSCNDYIKLLEKNTEMVINEI